MVEATLSGPPLGRLTVCCTPVDRPVVEAALETRAADRHIAVTQRMPSNGSKGVCVWVHVCVFSSTGRTLTSSTCCVFALSCFSVLHRAHNLNIARMTDVSYSYATSARTSAHVCDALVSANKAASPECIT